MAPQTRQSGTTPLPRPTRPGSRAFTLVEMLVVLLILSVVTALVVGVSGEVRYTSRAAETRSIQERLGKALLAYTVEKSGAPLPPGDGEADSGSMLYTTLRRNDDARAILQDLPVDAVWNSDEGRPYVLDGFGRPIRYEYTPAGPPPLLISLGADKQDPTDDIRTDVHPIPAQRPERMQPQ